METYWGVAIHFHAFLTSEVDGGERSASLPGRFIPSETSLIAFGKKKLDWIETGGRLLLTRR
jgi:hypothetical protein